MAKEKYIKIKVLISNGNGFIKINGSTLRPPVAVYVKESELKNVLRTLKAYKVPSEYILIGDEEIKAGKKLKKDVNGKVENPVEPIDGGNIKSESKMKDDDKSEKKVSTSKKSKSYKKHKKDNKVDSEA